MSLFSFLGGVLVDRIGPRILNLVGGLTLALGFFLSSRVNTLWQFYFSYSLLGGLGFSCVFISLSSTIPRWFIEKKGLALGLFYAGGGVGGLILSPLLQTWIDTYDWRMAFLIVCCLAAGIIIPAAMFLRKEPEEMGLLPLGKDTIMPKQGGESLGTEAPNTMNQEMIRDYTLPEALKAGSFWIFSGAVTLMLVGVMMAQVNMVPHATDKGVPAGVAALALGISSAFNSLGRLVMGAASDKIGTKRSVLFCLLLAMITLFWLPAVNKPWMIFVFAIPFGFAYGGFVPQIPRVISELFGVKSMGSILGLSMSITAVGPAFGPVIGGAVFDRVGSYSLAFIIGAVSISIGLVLVTLIKLPKR